MTLRSYPGNDPHGRHWQLPAIGLALLVITATLGKAVKALPRIDATSGARYGLIARKDWLFKQLQHYIKVHP